MNCQVVGGSLDNSDLVFRIGGPLGNDYGGGCFQDNGLTGIERRFSHFGEDEIPLPQDPYVPDELGARHMAVCFTDENFPVGGDQNITQAQERIEGVDLRESNVGRGLIRVHFLGEGDKLGISFLNHGAVAPDVPGLRGQRRVRIEEAEHPVVSWVCTVEIRKFAYLGQVYVEGRSEHVGEDEPLPAGHQDENNEEFLRISGYIQTGSDSEQDGAGDGEVRGGQG